MTDDDCLPAAPTPPQRAEPGEVAAAVARFQRALVELQIECDELASALVLREPIDVEIAACDLACDWHAARAALVVIGAVTAHAGEQYAAATLALRAEQPIVVRLFEHAFAAVSRWGREAPRLHQLLCRIASQLRLGDAHTHGAEPRPPVRRSPPRQPPDDLPETRP
jgi:hypothetical protein